MSRDITQRRRPWSRPLADILAPCLKPALARFGFDDADLLLCWPDIVGDRLAARCEPLRLQWPGRRASAAETVEAATLLVRVESAFAIELQHQAPVVIERINAHAGWRCVGRLGLRQGPVTPRPRERPKPVPPDADAIARARHQTGAIADEALREALARLGANVAAGSGRAPRTA